MTATEARRSWRARFAAWQPGSSLRGRLVLIVCAIITVILFGQAIVGLSGEVMELDARVATRGTILAQTVATAVEPAFEQKDAARFDGVIAQLRRSVDLVEAAFVDREGHILGHSEPERVGTIDSLTPLTGAGALGMQSPVRGLMHLFDENADYRIVAPVLRGDRILGFVRLHYRSDEVSRRAVFIVGATGGWALLWLLIGGTVATLYVRHITRPLSVLTGAVEALSVEQEGVPLAEVPAPPEEARDELATLQRAFRHLVASLRAERTENARLLDQVQTLNMDLQNRVGAVTADLRGARDHLEAVFGALEEGVMSCDAAGRIVRLNGAARRHLKGVSVPHRGDALGALVPAEADRLQRSFGAVVETGTGTTLTLEVETEGPAGAELRTLVLRIDPLSGGGGVVTVRDETEARRVEATLRRQDRLVSLGTLAAGLAHELGNHMHIIQGFAQVLVKRLPADSPSLEDAQAISEENRRAVHLLRRFLQFARPDEGNFVEADAAALVREALSFCRVELKAAGVAVEDRTGDQVRPILCDPHLLQQVFINLALNAGDALRESPERRLTVSVTGTPAGTEIAFADTGPGVPQALRDRIFDPFFTTKATGTGLGLAIAGRIVTSHRGRLTLQSEPGAGATFRIFLPRPEDFDALTPSPPGVPA